MTAQRSIDLARPVAPEDLRPGRYVAVLTVTYQFVVNADGPCGGTPKFEPLAGLPFGDSTPYRVEGVCLPFVHVVDPFGRSRMLDVRRHRFARLRRRFARRAIEGYRKNRKCRGALPDGLD